MDKSLKQKAYSSLGATESYYVDRKILSAFEEYDKGNKEAGDEYLRQADRLEKQEDNSGGRIDNSEEIERLEQAAKESVAASLSMQINEIQTDEDLEEAMSAVETAYYDGEITFDEYEDLLDSLEEIYLDSEYHDADEEELRGLGAFGDEEAVEELTKDKKESTDKIIELDPQECDGDEIAVGTVLELLKKTQYDYDLENFIESLPEVEGMSYDEARAFIESQGMKVDDKGVWIPSGVKMTYLGTANGWPSFQIGEMSLDFAGDILSFKILEEPAKEELIKDEKESTDRMPKEACAMEEDDES